MDWEVQVIFSTIFLGGMALAAADFSALRWLAFLQGLKASGHIRAALLTFSSVMVLPWIGMGLVVAFLAGARSGRMLPATVFLVWILVSLAYDWRVIHHCHVRLQGTLRRLASEGF